MSTETMPDAGTMTFESIAEAMDFHLECESPFHADNPDIHAGDAAWLITETCPGCEPDSGFACDKFVQHARMTLEGAPCPVCWEPLHYTFTKI